MNLYKCGGKTRLIFTWLLLHSVQWISLKSKALLMAWNTHGCDYQADTNAYRNHSTCKQLMYTWLKCQKKQHWLMHIHRFHALQLWFQWLFITIIVWFPSECVGMRLSFTACSSPRYNPPFVVVLTLVCVLLYRIHWGLIKEYFNYYKSDQCSSWDIPGVLPVIKGWGTSVSQLFGEKQAIRNNENTCFTLLEMLNCAISKEVFWDGVNISGSSHW